MAFNNLTKTGQRAQRKTLITVAEWTGAAHDVYTLQTSQPEDWATKYDTYYTYTGGQYVLVTGETAPAWAANTYYTKSTSTTYRQILGSRTEDSTIDTNPDIETTTDILGVTWTDVNKTEPEQTFDPFYVMQGSDLAEYLSIALMENNIDAYNNSIDIYIIASFLPGASSNTYKATKHQHCSVIPTSIGGDAWVNMPVEVHYSNDLIKGSVDKLADDFSFTPDATT